MEESKGMSKPSNLSIVLIVAIVAVCLTIVLYAF